MQIVQDRMDKISNETWEEGHAGDFYWPSLLENDCFKTMDQFKKYRGQKIKLPWNFLTAVNHKLFI